MTSTLPTSARPIRVMIVDDSIFMRKAVEQILKSAGDFEICCAVSSGELAIAQLEFMKPDCITMDVEMPGMGGLQAVKAIMAKRRTPIIMLSSLTARGTETTLQALENGAADVIAKPSGGLAEIARISAELVAKVRALGRRAVLRDAATAAAPRDGTLRQTLRPITATGMNSAPATTGLKAATAALGAATTGAHFSAGRRFPAELIVIGISTGGPAALSQVLSKVAGTVRTPIVIVQHMPPGFTKALADRLNSQCPLEVVEAEDQMPITPGRVIIGVSGKQLRVQRSGSQATVLVSESKNESLYMPSADVLFRSCATTFGRSCVAFIMTGMGNDGTEGLREMVKNGAYVYGQDEPSSVVYGMPRMAAEAGVVNTVLPLTQVAEAINAADRKFVV